MRARIEGPADPTAVVASVAAIATLFHGSDGTAYITVDEVRTFAIESGPFKKWVQRHVYREQLGVLNRGLDDVVGSLAAQATYDGKERDPYRRVAPHPDGVLVHLGGDDDRVVLVTSDGWSLIDGASPVPFLRPPGQGTLPLPERGGSLGDLMALGLSEEDARLVAAFLVGVLNPHGPYAILGIVGPPGSGKSTLAQFLAELVDPSAAALRGTPKQSHDLMIAARGGQLLVIDNVTSMPKELADSLCRMTSGTGAGYKRLYTDDEEVLFTGSRPFVVTGVDARLFSRGDVADRTLLLRTAAIDGASRTTLRRLKSEFDSRKARILGLVLDGVSSALATRDSLPAMELPRLADFTEWAASAGRAWGQGPSDVVEMIVKRLAAPSVADFDPVAQALADLAADEWGAWEGTATDLLSVLNERGIRGVPASPSALGRRLRTDDFLDDIEHLGAILDDSGRTGDRRRLSVVLVDA